MAFLPDCEAMSRSARPSLVWMLSLGGLLLLSLSAVAQSAQPAPASKAGETASSKTHSSRHVAHRHPRRGKAKAKQETVVAPAAAPPPVPPAQQSANPAKIDFRQGTLRIDADNSSLVQILTEISHKTGMVVDGLNRDERVYGQYGPGPVSSTLTKLLDGAGYNYIIVGGAADAAPTKLILTAGSSMPEVPAATPATPAASAGGAVAEPADPSAPVQAKTPQEIFDELRKMHQPH